MYKLAADYLESKREEALLRRELTALREKARKKKYGNQTSRTCTSLRSMPDHILERRLIEARLSPRKYAVFEREIERRRLKRERKAARKLVEE